MIQTTAKIKKITGAVLLLLGFTVIPVEDLKAATGYVGDERVEITRVSAGRYVYPRAALRREIEGSVILELTVGVTGDVVDAFVVEATPPNRFEKNALKYARSFK
jgi:TonB family protein